MVVNAPCWIETLVPEEKDAKMDCIIPHVPVATSHVRPVLLPTVGPIMRPGTRFRRSVPFWTDRAV